MLIIVHIKTVVYTTQHGAVLIIFPLNLQTSITTQILSIGGEGKIIIFESHVQTSSNFLCNLHGTVFGPALWRFYDTLRTSGYVEDVIFHGLRWRHVENLIDQYLVQGASFPC